MFALSWPLQIIIHMIHVLYITDTQYNVSLWMTALCAVPWYWYATGKCTCIAKQNKKKHRILKGHKSPAYKGLWHSSEHNTGLAYFSTANTSFHCSIDVSYAVLENIKQIEYSNKIISPTPTHGTDNYMYIHVGVYCIRLQQNFDIPVLFKHVGMLVGWNMLCADVDLWRSCR